MRTDGLLGHRAVLARLGEAVLADSLHHALLFEGPVGVGRRTVATHLAAASNCEHPEPTARPCGGCRTCRSIRAGTHPDVIVVEPEADSASGQIPVARIREVVRQAGFHRYAARKRFVIVDPAEALADPAANALLKTLEEPPAGTHFVLTTRNAKALLPTIVSRCQRVRFGPVPTADVATWLRGLAKADADAAAAGSHGCPGVALALADGGLTARRDMRTQLVAALRGPLEGTFAWSQKLADGARADWRPKATLALEVLEELLRDATVRASGSTAAPVHVDADDVVGWWADALWPDGVAACQAALADARLDLEVMVSGRSAFDALLTRFRAELGVAPPR